MANPITPRQTQEEAPNAFVAFLTGAAKQVKQVAVQTLDGIKQGTDIVINKVAEVRVAVGGGKPFLCQLVGGSIDKEFALLIPVIEKLLPIKGETLLIYAFHNIARKIFPLQTQKIENNVPLHADEVIPFEKLLEKTVLYLAEIAKKGFLELGEEVSQESFRPLANSLLAAILPEGKEGEGVRGLVVNKLIESLYSLYSNHLTLPKEEAKQDEGGPLDISEGLWGLVVSALAAPRLEAEKVYLHQVSGSDQLFDILSGLINELVANFKERVLFLKNVPLAGLQLAAKAALLSVLHEALLKAPAGPEHILQRAWSVVFAAFERLFARAPEDYITGIKEIIEVFFSHDLVEFFANRRPDLLDKIAIIVREAHTAYITDDRADYEQRLRVILWDPVELKRLHSTIEVIPEIPDVRTSQLLGSEKFVQQARNLCNNLGHIAVDLIKAQPNEEASEIQKILGWISFGDQRNGPLHHLIGTMISNVLFKALAIWLEKGKNVPGATKESSLFYAIKLLFRTFNKFGPELKQYENDGDMHKAYQPLAKALLKLFWESSPGMWAKLPLPQKFFDELMEKVCAEWAPALLHHMHVRSHEWIVSREQTRKMLREFNHNDRMAETAKFLAYYCEQYLPFYLRIQTDDANKFVVDGMKELMLNDNQEVMPESSLAFFDSMMRTSIKMVGTSPSKEIGLAFSFIRDYSEGFLLQVFLNMLGAVEKMPKKGPERPHVKAATLLFDEAQEHYDKYKEIQKRLKKSHVPDKLMRHHFGNRLHVLLKTNLPENQHEYFKKVGNKLLPILLPEKRIPAPSFMESAVWNELFLAGILPLLMSVLVNETKAPYSIHHYLNTLMKTIKNSLAIMDEKEQEQLDNVPKDALQRELEALLANLLQNFIGLQPSLAQPFTHFRSLWTKAGHEMGKSVRLALERSRPSELLEQMICSGLPLLHEGGWVTAAQMREFEKNEILPQIEEASIGDHFFPLRTNVEGQKEYGWDFKFPKNAEENQAFEKQVEQQRGEQHAQLNERVGEMIEYQGYKSFNETLKTLWKDIQTKLDRAIFLAFGEAGLKIKHALDSFFNFIWKHGLKYIVYILYPFQKIIEAIMHHYFRSQARRRVGDVSSPIHQNAFLRTVDKTLDYLEEKNRAVMAN